MRELRENAKSENLVQLEQIKFWQTQYFASKKLFGVTVLFLKYWITMEILKENICLLKYVIIFIILWAFYVMKEFAWIFFLKYSFGSVQSLSHVQLLRHQPIKLLRRGFSRQECWSGLPFPSPGDLPDPGNEPGSPAWRADALPSESPGKLSPRKTLNLKTRKVCSLLTGTDPTRWS